jgi:hypothetical protein
MEAESRLMLSSVPGSDVQGERVDVPVGTGTDVGVGRVVGCVAIAVGAGKGVGSAAQAESPKRTDMASRKMA